MEPILLATAGEDVRLWTMPDLTLQSVRNTTSGHVNYCTCSNNGHMVAYTQERQGINVAFLQTDDPAITLPTACEQSNVSFSTNSKYLVSAGKDGTVSLWDLKTRSIKRYYQDHTAPCSFALFNFNGNVVASGSTHGEIILTEVQSGSPSQPLIVEDGGGVVCLGYSHFTRYLLASCSEKGALTLWDTKESKLVKSFNEHSETASCLSFSPLNDMLLCSTGLDKKMIFYDVCYKKIVKTITADAPLTSCEFMHDGTTVACGSVTGQICIYDLRHGSLPLRVIPGHKTAVRSVSFQKIPKERPPIKRQADDRPKLPSKSPTEVNMSRSSSAETTPRPDVLKRASSYDALGRAEQIVTRISKERQNIASVSSMSTPTLENNDVNTIETPISPVSPTSRTTPSALERKPFHSSLDPNSPARRPMKREKSDLSRQDFKREKSNLSSQDLSNTESGTPQRSRRPSFERSKSGLSRILMMNRSSEDVSYFNARKKEKSSDDLFRNKKQNKDGSESSETTKKSLFKSPFKKRNADSSSTAGKRSDESETSSLDSVSIDDKTSLSGSGKNIRVSNRSNESDKSVASSPRHKSESALLNTAINNASVVLPKSESALISTAITSASVLLPKEIQNLRVNGDGAPAYSQPNGSTSSKDDEVFEMDTSVPVPGTPNANSISTKLIESMIEDAMQENRMAIHKDLVNLQVEFIRQMEIQQNQIHQMLEHYNVKDDLVREVLRLKDENNRLSTKY